MGMESAPHELTKPRTGCERCVPSCGCLLCVMVGWWVVVVALITTNTLRTHSPYINSHLYTHCQSFVHCVWVVRRRTLLRRFGCFFEECTIELQTENALTHICCLHIYVIFGCVRHHALCFGFFPFFSFDPKSIAEGSPQFCPTEMPVTGLI